MAFERKNRKIQKKPDWTPNPAGGGNIRNSNCKLPNVLHIVLTEIDKCSFGMYLIHLAVLKTIIAWIGWNPYNHGGTLTVLLLAFLVTVVSYCFIRILKLIPGVKKII